jgi:hypothetical protein
MNNAPETARAIEQAWSEELAAHFGVPVTAVGDSIRPWFGFPLDGVRVELMDGSSLVLRCAFHVVSESRRAIAIFTEHCGHFVVPCHEARVLVNDRVVYQQHAV